MLPINQVRLDKTRQIAGNRGWAEVDHQENILMVSFTNGPDRINVYYSRMTVTTVIDHPKLGRNSLYRRRVDFTTLEKIFENPRVHLGIGYKRRSRNEPDPRNPPDVVP